jgi:hypothetical protein
VGVVQRVVGQFGEERAGEKGVASGVLPEPPESPAAQAGAPEGPAQQSQLVHVKPAERQPRGATIAAHKALPSLTELPHPAGSAGEDHEYAIGAQPPEGEEQSTRGGQVNPLHVLNHHAHRAAALQAGDEGQQFHPDLQRIRIRARAVAEQIQASQRAG